MLSWKFLWVHRTINEWSQPNQQTNEPTNKPTKTNLTNPTNPTNQTSPTLPFLATRCISQHTRVSPFGNRWGERCKDSGFQLAQHRDGAVLIRGEFFFGKAEVSFVTGIVRKLPGKTRIGKAVSVFRFQIRYEMTIYDMHACVYLLIYATTHD